jgi:hypothetical protein
LNRQAPAGCGGLLVLPARHGHEERSVAHSGLESGTVNSSNAAHARGP